jgi:N-acyl-D-aspartate/D-glutamate deacylase
MLATFSYSTSLLAASRAHDLVPLEEAVHLLTDVQARLYGIRDRGRLAEGGHADVVVFDADRVAPGPVHTRHDLPGGPGACTPRPRASSTCWSTGPRSFEEAS